MNGEQVTIAGRNSSRDEERWEKQKYDTERKKNLQEVMKKITRIFGISKILYQEI